ncbi:MAG TPA: flagellar motor switch protein FliM [Verrucomicrobiae bacterium]|nr:flagellar motor switch protein FliM [Verrucomicrobiae bacterium]
MTTANEAPAAAPVAENAPAPQTLHWRGTTLLSPRQLRKLRLHEDEFTHALTARLSSYLRTEVVIKLGEIEVLPYQRLISAWDGPCHLGLFKTEPLRGVSILHLSMGLGMSLVDRMMGGPGKASTSGGMEMSEIEKALLDQLTLIIMEEWTANWAQIKELKPSALGSETSGSYLQTAAPQTNMLTLPLQLTMGELSEPILFAIPYPALDALIRQLTGESAVIASAPAPQPAPGPARWNPSLDDVKIPVTAEWRGQELAARDILNWKVGDVLPFDPERAGSVVVRLADLPKFYGRLGVVAEAWAIELQQPIKS